MSQALSPHLTAKLAGATERIRRANDELDGVIAAVDAFLRNSDLRIAATAPVDTPLGPCRISYGPFGKSDEWRLVVERLRGDADPRKGKPAEVESAWPLAEAPRPILLAAAAEVPALIDGIVSLAGVEAERIESAVQALRGPSDEPPIVDSSTRQKLDREFLELYAKRMAEEGPRIAAAS